MKHLIMNILLKWKNWRIEAAIKSLIKEEGYKPLVWSLGAYNINPKYLVFVVGVPTDKEKNQLKNNKEFNQSLKSLLEKFNWPKKARNYVTFDIESEETVNRETNGNWWYHYK